MTRLDLTWFDLIWLIELEFDWLNCWASGWSKDPLNYWLMGLIGWLVARLTRWRVERFTDWSVGWLIDWRTWRTDRMKWNGMERNGTERNERTNEWMNEWMNEYITKAKLSQLLMFTDSTGLSILNIYIYIYTYKHSTYISTTIHVCIYVWHIGLSIMCTPFMYMYESL